ncbi:MAG TPA: hypothetical protein VM328_06565 [Fimbriimonadaceae bacterium]|jgi:hypothetical protein|nr:hypothetical protein [Fimbriimonadaceae bacterium]
MKISIMAFIGLAVAQINWTRQTLSPWTYSSTEQLELHLIVHYWSQSNPTTSQWNRSIEWEQKVTGDSPSNGPSWTQKFAALQNGPLGISYFGGGETIPANMARLDYVPYEREVARETWTADQEPYVAVRDRAWEEPGAHTYRIVDYSGGGS